MRTFVIVGAGGTGSILAPLLTRLLDTAASDATVAIIDGDTIEPKNLDRQTFTTKDIGANKAEALRDKVIAATSGPTRVVAVPDYLADDNIASEIQNGDTVLICADNHEVRKRIEDRARTLSDVTVINGGNELRDGSVQVYSRREGRDLTPPLTDTFPEIGNATGRDPTALSCQQLAALPGGEQTLVANTLSAAWMLAAVADLMPEQENVGVPSWHTLMWDAKTGRARSEGMPA